MLAIGVTATKSYQYVLKSCIRSIAAAAAHHQKAHFIFSTDKKSANDKEIKEMLKSEIPAGWDITVITADFEEDPKSYNVEAQRRIAVLQGAAFACARSKVRATSFWNVESDNIVPPNSLRVLEWILQMPTAGGGNVYDIAAATYFNGSFLGGFGEPHNQINPNFWPEEKRIPKRLKLIYDEAKKRIELPGEKSEREIKRWKRISDRVEKCPSDGNIWEVIAKHGHKRRGWLDFAYPAIGEGSTVPVDWCGFGCTLLSERALAVSDFIGYAGRGTQDLFLCWERWHPNKLRIACSTHVLCSHVKRNQQAKEGEAQFVHWMPFHERSGEHRGHIRLRQEPWFPVD